MSQPRILHHTENPQRTTTPTRNSSNTSASTTPPRPVLYREKTRDWMFRSPDGGETELKTTYQREREGQRLGDRDTRLAARISRKVDASSQYQTSNSAIGKGCDNTALLVENLNYNVGKKNRLLNTVFSSDVLENRDARRKELLFAKKWNQNKRNDSTFVQEFR